MFALATTLSAKLSESDKLTWDMAKEIIQKQYDLSIFGIYILVGAAGIILAGTLVYNIFVNRYQIKELMREYELKMDEKYEIRQREIISNIEHSFNSLERKNDDSLLAIEKRLEDMIASKTLRLEAEQARLFAFVNRQLSAWSNEAGWWAKAISLNVKADNARMIRLCVKALKVALERIDAKMEGWNHEQVANCIEVIPPLLSEEKDEIKKLFDVKSKLEPVSTPTKPAS